MGLGIIGYVGRYGEKVVANDVSTDPRYISLIADQTITPAELCLAIKMAGQTVGILDIQSPRINAFNENDLMAMETLTHQIAVAFENARLYQAVKQELAERKQAEEALETERSRLRTLIDNLPDLIFLKDTQSRFLVANRATTEFMGVSIPEVLLGKSDFDFYWSELAAEYYSLEQQIIQSGEPVVSWEKPQRDTAGNPHWLSTIKTPLRDGQGQIIGLVGVERDITRRKQAEEEVRQRNRELTLLNEIIAASAAGLEPEVVLDIACRGLALTFDVPQATATLLNDEKTAALIVAEYRTEDRPSVRGSTLPVGCSPASPYMLQSEGPLVIKDVQNDPRLGPLHSILRQNGIASLLMLPLQIKGQLVGNLSLESLEPRSFSTEEINLAWSVADHVAGALTRQGLELSGYTVLEATHSVEALQLAEQQSGPLHLLVTDVIMPHMGGRELAEPLTALHPELKVLYISGYTDDAIIHHQVLEQI